MVFKCLKANKDKTAKVNSKFKNFCASKDTINKIRRESTEREKKFANHVTD